MQTPQTMNLRRKATGAIIATVRPVWDGEKFQFQAELFGALAGMIVTRKNQADAMAWADRETSSQIILDC